MTRAANRRWEDVEKDSMELGAVVKHFELFNNGECRSPKTIECYNLTPRQFGHFVIERERSTALGSLGTPP